MEPILTLALFSIAMLVGCYFAGSIPLAFSMSEDRLAIFTVFGAGLLIGTALTVIIPEGVNTLINQHTPGGIPYILVSTDLTLANLSALYINLMPVKHSDDDKTVETKETISNEAYLGVENSVGLSLLLGFLLMLLIDQLAGSHYKPDPESNNSTRGGRAPWMATLGLVVHAAADGIALGAAVASSRPEVEIIVFFAIMLHKAPAAFGLVTFLLLENVESRRIRKHLLFFSIAAPLGAFVTYFAIVQTGSHTFHSSGNSAGIAMLFSAGTFLYVSTVHVLPEILEQKHSELGSPKHFSRKQLLALIVGSLLPSLLKLGHKH